MHAACFLGQGVCGVKNLLVVVSEMADIACFNNKPHICQGRTRSLPVLRHSRVKGPCRTEGVTQSQCPLPLTVLHKTESFSSGLKVENNSHLTSVHADSVCSLQALIAVRGPLAKQVVT